MNPLVKIENYLKCRISQLEIAADSISNPLTINYTGFEDLTSRWKEASRLLSFVKDLQSQQLTNEDEEHE